MQLSLRQLFIASTLLSLACAYLAFRTQALETRSRVAVLAYLVGSLAFLLGGRVIVTWAKSLTRRRAGQWIASARLVDPVITSLSVLFMATRFVLPCLCLLGSVEVGVFYVARGITPFSKFFDLMILSATLGAFSAIPHGSRAQIYAHGIEGRGYLAWYQLRRYYWREQPQLELHLVPRQTPQLRLIIRPEDRAAVQKALDDAGLLGSASLPD